MPAASEYLPADKDIRHAADLEHRQRQDLHHSNSRYYNGQHAQPLRISGNYDDNITLNIAGAVVQESTDFAFPRFPTIQLDPDAETHAELMLQQMWNGDGDASVLLKNMAIRGALDGHVFMRVLPPENPSHLPELRLLPSENIVVFWDADDRERVLWYELQWTMGRTQYRQDIVAMPNHWLIRDYQRIGNRWDLQDEHVWLYTLGPLVDWQHLPAPQAFYGQHEFTHANLNDAINKVASDLSRILRYHGSPRTVGIGFEAEHMQPTSIDSFWSIANPDAKVFNLEMSSDLSSSMRFLEWLQAQYYRQSRVSNFQSISGTQPSYQNVTNLGLRVAFMSQLQKTETLHRLYGRGIEAISRRLLMLASLPYEAPLTVEWGQVLPLDSREQVDVVEKQIALGLMSKPTAAAQLGLNFIHEQQRQAANPPLDAAD